MAAKRKSSACRFGRNELDVSLLTCPGRICDSQVSSKLSQKLFAAGGDIHIGRDAARFLVPAFIEGDVESAEILRNAH